MGLLTLRRGRCTRQVATWNDQRFFMCKRKQPSSHWAHHGLYSFVAFWNVSILLCMISLSVSAREIWSVTSTIESRFKDKIQLRTKNKTRHYLESAHTPRGMIYFYSAKTSQLQWRNSILNPWPHSFSMTFTSIYLSPDPMAMYLTLSYSRLSICFLLFDSTIAISNCVHSPQNYNPAISLAYPQEMALPHPRGNLKTSDENILNFLPPKL